MQLPKHLCPPSARPAGDDHVQCGDHHHHHLHVCCVYKRADKRRRRILHDIKVYIFSSCILPIFYFLSEHLVQSSVALLG